MRNKTVFFIIGVLIVSILIHFGYSRLGHSRLESETVKNLTITDTLTIGNKDRAFITLTTIDNSATILLYSRSKFVAGLSVTDNQAELYLTDDFDRRNNIAQIKTGKTRTGKKLSLIRLKDIQGENTILTDWEIE